MLMQRPCTAAAAAAASASASTTSPPPLFPLLLLLPLLQPFWQHYLALNWWGRWRWCAEGEGVRSSRVACMSVCVRVCVCVCAASRDCSATPLSQCIHKAPQLPSPNAYTKPPNLSLTLLHDYVKTSRIDFFVKRFRISMRYSPTLPVFLPSFDGSTQKAASQEKILVSN